MSGRRLLGFRRFGLQPELLEEVRQGVEGGRRELREVDAGEVVHKVAADQPQ